MFTKRVALVGGRIVWNCNDQVFGKIIEVTSISMMLVEMKAWMEPSFFKAKQRDLNTVFICQCMDTDESN